MAIFKCKMCGGSLEAEKGQTICECEYCGTKQTISATDDEVTTNLYNRANNLRIKCEFDKAQEIYEKIVAKNPDEAEAFWGIVLCKYGIEYVEDPNTYKRVPTCHRTQLESVLTDVDYLSAIENADSNQRLIYEQEAKEIDKLQKDILSIVHNEKPFDVFICYKETDENGKRTIDSTLANDIYYQLTQEGLKVFYAAITLENKLGQEYEPYIFSALNSAKVMLVVGTKPENFNAVWVKNEWSRYLKLMSNDRSKTLIPCFRDMDAYDLPDEFSHLQAQDMGKIGFINDIVRGIKKLIAPVKEQTSNTFVVESNNTDIAPILKRAFIFLEDGNWKDADEYCERVLDLDPENAQAYLGKLMAELHVNKQDLLGEYENGFEDNQYYLKVRRYADKSLNDKLDEYIKNIEYINDEKAYQLSLDLMKSAKTEEEFINLSESFDLLENFKDSKELYNLCLQKAEICQKDEKYDIAKGLMSSENYKTAIDCFNEILGWKDAQEQIDICNQKIKEIEVKKKQQEKELCIAAEKTAKKRKKIKIIAVLAIFVCIVFGIILKSAIIPSVKYHSAVKMMTNGEYVEAVEKFESLGSYKDSVQKATNAKLEIIKTAGVGDKVYFGSYEQDNNTSNGKESIEWIVLAKENNRNLVISDKALDCQPYNEVYEYATWEECTLRKWLNNDFINSAFTDEEKESIPTVTVSADKNPKYSTDPGKATEDKVFLLSIIETSKYFSSNSARRCTPTNYAVANGVYKSDSGFCWWWLRSPGDDRYGAACVDCVGDVDEYGYGVSYGLIAVRPALWIETN